MYFRLTARLNLNAGLMKKEANLSQTLINGRPIDPRDLVLPWPFSLRHKRPEPLHMADFYPSGTVMSERLIDVLKSAGVDNLQLFKAQIVNEQTKEEIAGYQVVNILGLVSAADENASKSRPLAHVRFFEKLILDETRARGQLMFRLAESLTDIIIAESVAKRIGAGTFVDVLVEDLSQAGG